MTGDAIYYHFYSFSIAQSAATSSDRIEKLSNVKLLAFSDVAILFLSSPPIFRNLFPDIESILTVSIEGSL